MSITGNFARGTGCWGTTSVDRGLYSRMFGTGNSGSLSDPGRACSAPRLCGPCGACAIPTASAAVNTKTTKRARRVIPAFYRAGGRKRRSRPISRILFHLRSASLAAHRASVDDDHSSRPGIARGLERPTRWLRTGSPVSWCSCHPIWSCSVRGFACHRRCRRRGALLPHLFTLTPRLSATRYARGRLMLNPCIERHDMGLP